MKILLTTLTLVLAIRDIQGYEEYMKLIPNSANVINPATNKLHPGVGHVLDTGTGANNCFGKDFKKHGKTWRSVCSLDSDNDGRTNGAELGDPDCKWVEGPDISGNGVTDPGVCTPLDTANCKYMNSPDSDCMFLRAVNGTVMTTPSRPVNSTVGITTTMRTTTSTSARHRDTVAVFWSLVWAALFGMGVVST